MRCSCAGGFGPLVAPHILMRPADRAAARERCQVASPTLSTTTCAPPPVTVIEPRVDDHAVALGEAVPGNDDPGAVGAEDARLRHGGESLADPDVEVVERGGAQLDQDMSRAWHRIRRVLVAEHLGPAVFMDANRFHGHNLP